MECMQTCLVPCDHFAAHNLAHIDPTHGLGQKAKFDVFGFRLLLRGHLQKVMPVSNLALSSDSDIEVGLFDKDVVVQLPVHLRVIQGYLVSPPVSGACQGRSEMVIVTSNVLKTDGTSLYISSKLMFFPIQV
jgi:hypothetical protein